MDDENGTNNNAFRMYQGMESGFILQFGVQGCHFD
jgi:hypothetical protein